MKNNHWDTADNREGENVLRLLMVEDNPGDADLVREMIACRKSDAYDVMLTERLTDALSVLKRQDFDLILLDLNLPDSDGLDTVAAVTRSRPDIPVVVMTGNDDEATGMAAVKQGAQDFLIKGAIPEYFLGRVLRYAMERHHAKEYFRESERFLRTTLDALSANIAILDEEGRILAVNRAWRRFGAENDAAADRVSEGMDYLAVCRNAIGDDRESAAAFADGIQDVIDGARDYFEMEYPCHAPSEKRWFVGRVTPFPGAGPKRVVVAHENITRRREAEESLKETNRRLDEAQRIARIGHWEWDVVADRVQWSDETYRVFGLTPGEADPSYALARSCVHPDDLKTWEQGVKKAISGGDRFWLEYRAVRKDGETIWIQNQAEIMRDAEGSPLKFSGTAQDITESKRAEAALRASEERLRLVLDASPNCVFIKDSRGRYLMVNKALATLYDLPQSEMVGKRDSDLAALGCLARSESEKFAADDRSVLAHQRAKTIAEESFTRRDGSVEWFYTIKTPINLPGLDDCVLGIAVEITQQRSVKEALRDSELRFRTILDSLTGVIFHLDKELNILWANRTACDTLGRSRRALQGRRCHEAWRHDEGACAVCPVVAALESGRPQTETIHRSDGTTWRIMGVPVRDGSGEIVSAVEVSENITEQISMESQFRQAQKMEAIGRLAGGVAHDFNNMLTVIVGYGGLIHGKMAPDDPMRHDMDEILDAAKRSTELVRQLLAFARQQVVSPRVVDLNQAVESFQKMLRRLVGEEIQVTFTPDPELWRTMIDPVQVDQILANLAVNSRDAIDGTGLISIETRNVVLDADSCQYGISCEPGGYVMLSFSDTGSGMDEDTLERIFDPFFTTKETGKGTGLGLSTVFGIVQQNKGGIKVQSEPGQGSVFKIFLPRHRGERAVALVQDSEKALAGSGAVLVVEDEKQILKLTQKMLLALGYTVFAQQTPAEAIAFCESHAGPIDLLLTDVIMPEMNGRELRERIERLRPDIKTLFMSGYTSDVVAEKGILTDREEYIQKPFNRSDLSRKIHQILNP